nr:reverse transcriptase domain-containing protein [Tanacetum cinerariifolium]
MGFKASSSWFMASKGLVSSYTSARAWIGLRFEVEASFVSVFEVVGVLATYRHEIPLVPKFLGVVAKFTGTHMEVSLWVVAPVSLWIVAPRSFTSNGWKLLKRDLVGMLPQRNLKEILVMDILKKDKIKAKTDKTEHGMEKREKSKLTKGKVKDGAETEEILNGPTHTHLVGRVMDILKKDKIKAKTDKTEHGMEKREKSKLTKGKVKDGAETEEILNGPTHTHLWAGRSKQPFILQESVDTMADQRTMAELLRAPAEGYVEAIMVPSILAEHFELKHSLINMMTSDQFFRLEKDNPYDHIRSGPLPSNTIANPKGKLKTVTTQSGLVLNGPSVPMPPLFINPEEDEHVEETLTDSDLAEYTIEVPRIPELISTRMTLELANQAICTPTGIARDVFDPVGKFTLPADFVIVDYESDPQVLLVLGRPFLWTVFALIDVHGEEMILRDEVINPLSGNPTSSSPDHLLEEFTDELALITFPLGNDDLPFNIEYDLREMEYLHNQDPTKEMDYILEDSVDKDNLADPNNNLVDIIPQMFTDEHTPDYSSPPLYDDFDDDLVELESDNDDVYNDPFDSKVDKIKESKLLIDELDPPRSSDLLPSSEYDSFLFEDFSKVDPLPSTNNEDKVFNPGILIHENLSEVTVRVAPTKNLKKISTSHASLILEDFDPPLYELPFQKKFLGLKLYSGFHPKMSKKFSNL